MDENKLKQAIEKAKQNPSSLFAKELRRRIESGQFANSETKETEPKKEMGILGKMASKTAGSFLRGQTTIPRIGLDLGIGAVKGALHSAQGLGQLALRGTEKLLGKEKGKLHSQETFFEDKQVLEPKGAIEKTAYMAEQMGEFLIPSGAIAGTVKGMSLLGRAGVEAGVFGGTSAIQTGEIGTEAKTSALIGAIFPFAGAVFKAIPKGGARIKLGEKIQATVIKPIQRDIKDGFKVKNINKFNLGGSLKETAVKTHIEINKRVKILEEIIKKSKGRVNINNVLNKTVADFEKSMNKFRGFGNIGATERAVKDLGKEITAVAEGNININLVEATLMKRGAGSKGAWAFGMPDRDAKALEQVYSKFYYHLKTAIEKSAGKEGGQIAKINKEISEMIPISNAVIRRLPIAQRNNVISLTDSIGLFASMFDPKALGLIGAKKLLSSGRFGSFLAKSGAKAKQARLAQPRTAIGERVFGGSLKNTGIDKSKIGLSIEDVSKGGFVGLPNLTLKTIEKLKGKTIVSKQFISDLTNAPDLKQAERDMIRRVLKEMPEGKVNVKEFADKVKTELLPLKVVDRERGGTINIGRYENVTLSPEVRGNVANYGERIYTSPIKTSAGDVHFQGHEEIGGKYFAHTRIEDMADNQTRRVIEVQSDLMQKGRLESEFAIRERRISKLTKESDLITKDRFGNTELAPKGETLKNINIEKQQLQPYRNDWCPRIIKEEIKQASKGGKKRLQFPTGETIMKIEGLGETASWKPLNSYRDIKPEELKVGLVMSPSNDLRTNWTVTDVLGDGKFKAISKNHIDIENQRRTTKMTMDEIRKRFDIYRETFDISGKVDTSDPIYKFYEKEVQKYLKRIEPQMKLITDEQGVTWFEIPISKAQAKEPITAFGKAQIGALVGMAGATTSAIGSVIGGRIKYERPKTQGPQRPPTNTPQIAKGLAYAETRGVDKPYSFSQWSNPKLGAKSKYGKALGKYQITEARLKEKSKAFLGVAVTTKEFLKNPYFQDKFIKKQIDWLRENGLTDDEIIAVHRHGWGNMTQEQLQKAVKERGGYIKDVQTGMDKKVIKEKPNNKKY